MSERTWVMPHEMTYEEVSPSTPKWVMPHEDVAELSPEEQAVKKMTGTERLKAGAKQRLSDLGRGGSQLLNYAVNIDPQYTTLSDEEAKMRSAILASHEGKLGAGGVDLGLGAIPVGRGLRAGMAYGTGVGALEPADTFGDRLTNMGTGAVAGGVGAKLGSLGVSGVAKLKNMQQGRYINPDVERRVRIFRENQMPYNIGDATQNPTIQAIENFGRKLHASSDLLPAQAARLKEVIANAPERIAGDYLPSGSKEDLNRVIAGSIKEKYKANRAAATNAYNEVADLVNAAGAPPVPVTGMTQKTNDLLARNPSVFAKLTDNPKTLSTLEAISQGVAPKQSTILGTNGTPIAKPANISFDELRDLDIELGDMIRRGKKLTASGGVGSRDIGTLVEVQNALRKDVTNWSNDIGSPEIATKLAEANKFYKEGVVPFRKDATIRGVLEDKANLDTLASRMFKLDSPETSMNAIQFMTPDGIQAGRYHLISEAKKKALADTMSGDYHPNSFLAKTELGETGPKLFTPEELGKLDNLRELLASTGRAGDYLSQRGKQGTLETLAPLLAWKPALAAKILGGASEANASKHFTLASPELYTVGSPKVDRLGNIIPRSNLDIVSGALGQAGETMLRNAGRGSMTGEEPLLRTLFNGDDQQQE